jgi:hypothetical protein
VPALHDGASGEPVSELRPEEEPFCGQLHEPVWKGRAMNHIICIQVMELEREKRTTLPSAS